ncbi:MAG: heme d1 biosynthesis radical SAM protein NirJ [Magnetococcales bacterium]|nr:heme d1 biosynthesis radical SAM protein NirJ [Magnetococcales bacterium]
MFRLSQIMGSLFGQKPQRRASKARSATGPVVVWNVIRRCNLTCRHCYTASTDKDFSGELSTNEVFRVLQELKDYSVPAVILSGGEPLLRPDIFEIAAHAKKLGFYLGLSSNGTMMDKTTAKKIADSGFDYVGVSLDGLREKHDHIRGRVGAFDDSINGIRNCSEMGVKAGIRFTPTNNNITDLPAIFELMEKESIDRFYLSHWNYAGRGNANRKEDSAHLATRNLVESLINSAKNDLDIGSPREFVTGNNDADGVFFLMWIAKNYPQKFEEAEQMLLKWGGNASGVGIANIDNQGHVHPDIFWWNYSLGDLKKNSFAEIWGSKDPLLQGLRQRPRPVTGRCGACKYLAICGGNTRVRAYQQDNDFWSEDPGCYLSDEEIGVTTKNKTKSTTAGIMNTLLFVLLFTLSMFSPHFLSSAHALSYEQAQALKVEELYQQNCAQCHHPERLGGMGPALLPENLKRLRQAKALKVISEGRPITQMPAFEGILSKDEIKSLVKLIYTPLPKIPKWGLAEIEASRVEHIPLNTLPKNPVHNAELLNMFIVVELADHHATILDGDLLKPIHRFPTRFALHGGPKYSPDGRFVYFGSRDGWVSKFDMFSLQVVAEIRAGINMRNVAISGDGKTILAANYLPHTLVAIDAQTMRPIQVIAVADKQNGQSSRISAVYVAPPRNSFIAALKDMKEVWEIPYKRDLQADNGNSQTSKFTVNRIHLDDYLDDFFFTQNYRYLIGASRDGGKGQVIDMDLGKRIASIDIPGMPHLGSGITWKWQGRDVMATPNLKEGVVSVIDLNTWEVIKRIKTKGPGFFMRSHEKTPYAWVDVFFGDNRDLVHVIDKSKLEIVKTLRPDPGKTSAHVEFTRDGRYALLSIWDKDGALVIYDGDTLKEVKRIPMKKPSGKYNVYNKITRSSGTSH